MGSKRKLGEAYFFAITLVVTTGLLVTAAGCSGNLKLFDLFSVGLELLDYLGVVFQSGQAPRGQVGLGKSGSVGVPVAPRTRTRIGVIERVKRLDCRAGARKSQQKESGF